MYKISITQELVHKRNNGETWTSDEHLEGTAIDFETATTLMGIITEVFPNTTVTISATNNTTETEED